MTQAGGSDSLAAEARPQGLSWRGGRARRRVRQRAAPRCSARARLVALHVSANADQITT